MVSQAYPEDVYVNANSLEKSFSLIKSGNADAVDGVGGWYACFTRQMVY